ncbi:MAG TPA: DUF3787 domain-containing protein [Ruminiclostridium sp.]|jgi:hypothetical protein|nr:DUF3787 domain-containing protein [Clostridiaceae bacterium]HAA26308.1 DUF3787 domain-containing protein [Ruminiclostridium sp.]
MADNRTKPTNLQKPIERHNTASWADMRKTKRVSNVLIPTESGVINAKEYVDQNQK